jgi:hypothetical protein
MPVTSLHQLPRHEQICNTEQGKNKQLAEVNFSPGQLSSLSIHGI